MSLWASQYTCENKIAKVKTAFPDRATYEVGGQVCLATGDTASELILPTHDHMVKSLRYKIQISANVTSIRIDLCLNHTVW